MQDTTYELTILFPKSEEGLLTKNSVIEYLHSKGVENFVEGVVDELDLDHEYGWPDENYYEEHGGDYSPIILCSFDQNYLKEIEHGLKERFSSKLETKHVEMPTSSWQVDWKQQFHAIKTRHFCIRPTWEKTEPEDKHTVYIEPGMAFGTGQHLSTQLCLRLLDFLVDTQFPFHEKSILDVGTGTGILAISCAKKGGINIDASDIDKDALIAARENAGSNSVILNIYYGSIPPEKNYDLIIANIIFKVLAPMLNELSTALRAGGLLILSGLVQDQAEEIVKLASQHSLEFFKSEEENTWTALLFKKII